jgi:PKD repeat protein
VLTCISLCLGALGLQSCGATARPERPSGATGAVVRSAPQDTIQQPVSQPVAQAPLGLPSPGSLLRQAAFTLADGYNDGADYDTSLPNNRTSAAGDSAVFAPAYTSPGLPMSELAYAIFPFTLPDYTNDAPVDIELTWSDAPAVGSCFVGLSDYDGGKWAWFSLPADNRLLFNGFTEYISQSDTHLLTVVVRGSDAAILDSLQLSTAQPPVASFTPDVDSGLAPLGVAFDATASTDPDGTIVDYEWDLDGDGLFNESGEESLSHGFPAAGKTYQDPGTYDVTLRVTDNDDFQDEAVVQINVSASQPPVADLQADVTSGDKPVVVTLDAGGSMDPDGDIVDYEWDFDGDNVFNESSNGEDIARGETPATVTYVAVGEYDATVRVTDDDGGKDTAIVHISVTNAAPNAVLQIATPDGNVPFTTSFSAESSTDVGGTITDYEWDFDGDGLYNEAGTEEETAHGNSAPADIPYDTPGEFTVSLRVKDDDNATDVATGVVSAHGWLTLVADDPAGNPAVNHCNLAVISGKPAIAYCIIGGAVRYGFADTVTGAAVADWTFYDLPGNTGQEVSLAETAVGPAVAAYLGGSSFDLVYQVAAGDGSDSGQWSSVVTVDATGNTGRFPELRIVSGNPAITYWNTTNNQMLQTRSITNSGDLPISWLGSVIIEDAAADENIQPLECYDLAGGNPAVAYYYYDNPADHLRFVRSSDALGDGAGDWTNKFNLDNDDGSGSWSCFGIQTMSGNPAIMYRDPNGNQTVFRTASNAGGTAWNAGLSIAPASEVGGFGSFLLVDGNPALAYQTNSDGDLKYVRSETASGAAAQDWDTVETIDTTNYVGAFVHLVMVDGKPAVCYQDSTLNAIKYAIRF